MPNMMKFTAPSALAEFMGANILAEVNWQPLRRNDLMADWERRAVRAARL
jgi:hypothetical protein